MESCSVVPQSFIIIMVCRQFSIRNRSAALGTIIDGNNGVRVIGQVAFPSLSNHSRMAWRSNVRPDRVMMGSTKTSKVRGQMNSGGTTVEFEFGIAVLALCLLGNKKVERVYARKASEDVADPCCCKIVRPVKAKFSYTLGCKRRRDEEGYIRQAKNIHLFLKQFPISSFQF